PVPEPTVSPLIVREQHLLRLAQRLLVPQPLLLLRVDSLCFQLVFFAVVRERLCVPVTHEWSVHTAPSTVVFASARRQVAGRARTKPRTGLKQKWRQAYLARRPATFVGD